MRTRSVNKRNLGVGNFNPQMFHALYAASRSETKTTASYMRTDVSIKPIRLFSEITIIDFLYDYTCDYCHTSFKKAKFHSVISHSCVITPKARIPYRDQLRKRERQKRTIQVHNPESNQANPSSTTETATTTETIHQSSTKGTPSNHNTERETELLKEGQPIEGEAFSHIDIDALDISTQLARPWDNPQPLLWSLVG